MRATFRLVTDEPGTQPLEPESEHRPADEAHADPDHAAPHPQDELDGLRIRQVVALRRGAYRARSYALICAAVCVVAAVQLAIITVAHVHAHGLSGRPLGYVLFACVALMLGGFFARRALELHREARTPPSLPPAPPEGPDFSTLSDGSQQWKNLDEIR